MITSEQHSKVINNFRQYATSLHPDNAIVLGEAVRDFKRNVEQYPLASKHRIITDRAAMECIVALRIFLNRKGRKPRHVQDVE